MRRRRHRARTDRCYDQTAMGLSTDAIRLLMLRIADEQRLPFEVKVPNAATRRAMAELEQGKGKRFDSAATLLEDLDI
jgi:DNA-damage-inducible protein J